MDIFVEHNSPRFIHEREEEVHVEIYAFVRHLLRAQAEALIHGHQHVNTETQRGETRVIGIYRQRL